MRWPLQGRFISHLSCLYGRLLPAASPEFGVVPCEMVLPIPVQGMPLLCTVLSFHELNLMAHIRSAARTFSSVQTRKLFVCMQAVLACCFSACMSELPSKSYATGKTRIIIIVSTAGNTLSAVRCERPDKLCEPACVHTCTCTPLRVQCKLVNGVKDV